MKKYSRVIGLFFIIFVIFTILMYPSSQIINISAYKIIDFEFVWTKYRAEVILQSWINQDIVILDAVKESLWFDYGWLVGYGGVLWGLLMAKSKKKNLTRLSPKLFSRSAIFALIAAGLDAIENGLLLWIVYSSNKVSFIVPPIASFCALLKFILVIYTLLILLGGIFFRR